MRAGARWGPSLRPSQLAPQPPISPAAASATFPIVSKIREVVSEPIKVKNHQIVLTCSIGIAVYPFDGENPDILLENADTAMYQAKGSGRDDCRYYAKEVNAQCHEVLRLEEDGAEALQSLSQRGVRVAVADFGTGYCALHYLRQLPVDMLKVNHSFVRDLEEDSNAASIVSALSRSVTISGAWWWPV